MSESKPKLLVFELHHLGDALMSFPFIKGAEEKFEVWVVCSPGMENLYYHVLPVDRVLSWLPIWQGGGWKQSWAAVRTWRRLQAKVAVCVWADVRVHLLMLFSGAGRRAGYPMNRRNYYAHERTWRKRKLCAGKILQGLGTLFAAGRLLTNALDRADYLQHHLEDWHQLSNALELSWRVEIPWLQSDVNKIPDSTANFLREVKNRGQKLWMVHSGGRLPTKRWPREYFKAIIDSYFRKNGIPCLVFGEGWEHEISDDLIFFAPVMDLGAFVAVMNRVDLFLGNDSFPAHLSAALGKRSISIFGSGKPDWFAPWGSENITIAAKNCPYWPCVDRCQMPSYVCLEAVNVEDVVQTLKG